MDGSWVAFGGAVIALVGTIAVAVLSRRTLIQTSKLQIEQAKLSVNAASSLALMTQQAEKSAAFFSAIEQLDRLTQSSDFNHSRIRSIAERVNIESALLQPFLNLEMARTVMKLARSFDAVVAADSNEEVERATNHMKTARSEFLISYFANREKLAEAARPLTDISVGVRQQS